MTTQIALNAMGIRHKSSGDKWGIAPCPLHPDRSPSMSVNYDRGTWKCYSGCGNGGMVDLAVRMIAQGQQVNLAEVKRIMESFKDPMAYERSQTEVDKMLSKLTGNTRNRILDDAMLNGYLPYSKHILDRGIDKMHAGFFGIKFDMVGNRIVIPIRDHAGNLRGIEARNMDGKPKYGPIVACDKGNWVWGAHKVEWGASMVVFEGALGAARAATLGVARCVALLGSSFRKSQLYRLVQTRDVIIALDPDRAGRNGAERLYGELHKHVSTRIATLPKDIDEITSGELKEALMI